MFCKSCEPEIVFVWICTLAEQFHVHKSYKMRESTLSCIGNFEKNIDLSAAASGWAGWALAHPEIGSSVNPITTRGADYAHHITARSPEFENLAASLCCIY